jgi:F-type H+-transporting ATPase subunit b
MSLLLPETGLLFWMFLSFGIVVFILGKFAFPVILKMIDEREKYVSDSLTAAEEAKIRLEDLEEQAKDILSNAQNEQLQLLKEAGRMKEEIVAQAKVQAAKETTKLIEEAKQAIVKQQEDAMKEIRRQVTLLATDITEKLLRKQLGNEKEQLELIDQLLDEINASK